MLWRQFATTGLRWLLSCGHTKDPVWPEDLTVDPDKLAMATAYVLSWQPRAGFGLGEVPGGRLCANEITLVAHPHLSWRLGTERLPGARIGHYWPSAPKGSDH